MIKMLVCDFDGTLDGGPSAGVEQFSSYIQEQTGVSFVIATGRTLPSIKQGLSANSYPTPRSIISDVGTQIHHDNDLIKDDKWQEKLQAKWNKSSVQEALQSIDFLGDCNAQHQGDYKLTFEGKLNHQQYVAIAHQLQQYAIEVDLTYSHDWFLDITPKGINKASAIHYLMRKHRLSAEEVCVAGDSANDTSMLTISGVNSILVANHYQEVAHLTKLDHVYTSKATHAQGVLEGLKYWQSVHLDK
jgi:sucrose-6F-phosphate phosphohydrolase